jgi:hypothetical protein
MSPLRLNGSTSGNVSLDAPAVAGNNTLTLPSGSGSATQFLKNSTTAGTLTWSGLTENGSGDLTSTGYIICGGGGIYSRSDGNRHLWFTSNNNTSQGIVYSEAATGDMIIDCRPGGTPSSSITVHADQNLGVTASYFRTSSSGGRMRMTTQNLLNFHWNNAFYYNIDNNSYVLINSSPSDARFKTVESSVSSASEIVKSLNPVRFSYKEDCPISVSTEARYGFIAQELQQVLPELITEAGLPKKTPEFPEEEIADPGTYLRYSDDASKQLIAVLTAALQEALVKIETLESRIAALEVTP